MKIEIRVDDKLAQAAFQRMPGAIERRIDEALMRGAEEVARAARDKAAAHDWQGTLKQSIKTAKEGDLHYSVKAGVNYARYVEEGTGPAVGHARYFPDWTNLIEYVKRRAVRGGESLKKAGSKSRFYQEREFENRAFQLARYISHHGTKPAPFMKPALEENESRVRQMVRRAVMDGIGEVFP